MTPRTLQSPLVPYAPSHAVLRRSHARECLNAIYPTARYLANGAGVGAHVAVVHLAVVHLARAIGCKTRALDSSHVVARRRVSCVVACRPRRALPTPNERSRDRDADWRVIGGEDSHSVHVRISMYEFYMYDVHTLICNILDVACFATWVYGRVVFIIIING